MPPSLNKRGANDPDNDFSDKRPRLRFILPRPDDGEHTLRPHMPEPLGPMEQGPHAGQQARATGPSGIFSQQRLIEVTSQIPRPSSYEETTAPTKLDRSTSGWDQAISQKSESALGAGHTTSHLGVGVKAQWASPHSPIGFRAQRPCFGNTQGDFVVPISAYRRRFDGACEPPADHLTPWLGSEHTPIPMIAQTLRLGRDSERGYVRTSQDTSKGGEDYFFESHPLPMMATLEGLPEVVISSMLSASLGSHSTEARSPAPTFEMPTCQISSSTIDHFTGENSPPDSCNLVSSSSSMVHTTSPPLSSFSPSQSPANNAWVPLPELIVNRDANYSPAMSDGLSSSSSAHLWNQPMLENTRYNAASTSSSSPLPPSTMSSRSRSQAVHCIRAPMGTVSEATVLWLVRNVPPPRVSGLLPEALSLRDPETELSVLVLQDVLGRPRVTAQQVNEFEATVYDESMDERQCGRWQRKPRRRSNN